MARILERLLKDESGFDVGKTNLSHAAQTVATTIETEYLDKEKRNQAARIISYAVQFYLACILAGAGCEEMRAMIY